jgi:hypothetical protein
VAPFDWTAELVESLCANIAGGMSVREACAEPGAPSEPTVYRKMSADPEFAAKLSEARAAQQEREADVCVELADGATPEDWQVVKLRIWARQWRAAKLAPKKYGDKQQVEHSGAIDTAGAIIAARKARGGR